MNLTALALVLGFGVLVALTLGIAGEDKRSQEVQRGWRLRCVLAGHWVYEEKRGDSWVSITFEEISDYREPPHIIDLRRAERWAEFPAWALQRREEIISRVKTELVPPQYVLKEA
jgi:hypothetical protein